MSRAPKFKPMIFAESLATSGDHAFADRVLYRWIGTHWMKINDDDALKAAIQCIAATDYNNASAANAHSALQTAALWLPPLKDAPTAPIIPLQNGYLHLEGGPILRAHDKELGLRHVLACDYAPTTPQPAAFDKFLETILPDDTVRSRVQEYVGYTLLPDARFQLAQIWIGSGANGKGTLASIVRALHGKYTAASPSQLDKFYAAQLIGASLIYCDEAPPQDWCEQIIKSMIAGEPVFIDRKYLPGITTRITGKWIICANHIPVIKDQSNGFWRRFDIVPFNVEVPAKDRDPLLAEHIVKHELTGVLNWALAGLQRLLARGRFDATSPLAMITATQNARMETNSVHAWVNDAAIERTTTTDTSKSEVYTVYSIWCRSNGMVPVASPTFWKRLPDTLGEIAEGRATTGTGRIRTCNVRLP